MRKIRRKLIACLIALAAVLVVGTVYFFAFIYLPTTVIYTEAPAPERFEVEEPVRQAVSRLSEEADVYILSDTATIDRTVFLTFDGLADSLTTLGILDLLDKYGITASFFLPGIRGAEFSDDVVEIVRRGHHIGNYTLSANPQMQNLCVDALAEDFAMAQTILADITGSRPEMMKARSTVYNEEILRAAGAAGIKYIVDSHHYLSFQSLPTRELAAEFATGLERGAILSVVMDRTLDEKEFTGVQTESLHAAAGGSLSATNREQLLRMLEYLFEAFAEQGFNVLSAASLLAYETVSQDVNFPGLQASNDGELAEVLTNVRTTQRGIAINIRHIRDGARLDRVLSALSDNDMPATFFVTAYEVADFPDRIERILREGHTVANGGTTGLDLTRGMTFDQIALEIYMGGRALSDHFGVQTNFFMPAGGHHNALVHEAANALGYTVVHYNKNPIGSHVDTTPALREHLRRGFARGDILYMDMGNFDRWEAFIPVIMEIALDSGMQTRSLEWLMERQCPEPLPLQEIDNWDAAVMNPDFNRRTPRRDEFFTRIRTYDSVIFLTFDDWGSDRIINRILDTLDYYDAMGSFFVIGSDIVNNPNLLRAIDEAGHDIFNHSYSHLPLTGVAADIDITPLTAEEIQEEVVKTHHLMTQILGRSPGMVFRPPYLQANNYVLNAIFATGYKYTVSGNILPRDWEWSAEQIADRVLAQARPGSIIIMHMFDHTTSVEAMEIFMPVLIERGFSFPLLSDYLTENR